MPRKLHVDDGSRKPKYMFSFSAANYSLKLHKKHSIRLQRMESEDFTRHCIIRYRSARELVLPPLIHMHPFHQQLIHLSVNMVIFLSSLVCDLKQTVLLICMYVCVCVYMNLYVCNEKLCAQVMCDFCIACTWSLQTYIISPQVIFYIVVL